VNRVSHRNNFRLAFPQSPVCHGRIETTMESSKKLAVKEILLYSILSLLILTTSIIQLFKVTIIWPFALYVIIILFALYTVSLIAKRSLDSISKTLIIIQGFLSLILIFPKSIASLLDSLELDCESIAGESVKCVDSGILVNISIPLLVLVAMLLVTVLFYLRTKK
jgi:hypothetical protein